MAVTEKPHVPSPPLPSLSPGGSLPRPPACGWSPPPLRHGLRGRSVTLGAGRGGRGQGEVSRSLRETGGNRKRAGRGGAALRGAVLRWRAFPVSPRGSAGRRRRREQRHGLLLLPPQEAAAAAAGGGSRPGSGGRRGEGAAVQLGPASQGTAASRLPGLGGGIGRLGGQRLALVCCPGCAGLRPRQGLCAGRRRSPRGGGMGRAPAGSSSPPGLLLRLRLRS